MSDTISSCVKLRALILHHPFDTSTASRLVRFLATDALDTRSRPGFTLSLIFELYPGYVAPTANDWRSLDDVLQTPAHEFLGRIVIGNRSFIIPEKSEIVWANTHQTLETVDHAFANKLQTLLPRTYQRQLLWWRHADSPNRVTLTRL